MPEEDFPEFLETMRRQLPATFRINGSGQYAQKLRERLQTDFLKNLVRFIIVCCWLAGGLAYIS